MNNKFVIKKYNNADFVLQLVIDDSDMQTDSEKGLDVVLYGSKSDAEIVAQICKAEYEFDLKVSSSDILNEDEFVYSTGLQYRFPDDTEEPELAFYAQEKGKVIHWPILLSAEKEDSTLTAELYAFRRDTMGNIEKLHPDNNTIEIVLLKDQAEYGSIVVNISRANEQAMDCGRYYVAFRLRRKNGKYVDEKPVISFLNIVPAKGSMKPIRSNLVGMEPVYHQMELLAKQKIFNDSRIAMNLSPSPINLHAAVMGGKGAGKTSFAHILFDFYVKNGLLPDGKLRVIDGSKWVNLSEDTSPLEDDISGSRDGMLYVENAAAMIPRDFKGNKLFAVQGLIRQLKDKNTNTVVILSDTPNKMTELLATAELGTYIGQVYKLPTLNLEQMIEVAERECQTRGFVLTPDAKKAMKAYLASQAESTTTEVVRLIDTMIQNMSVRVVNGSQELFQQTDLLSELLAEDVPQPEIGQYDRSVSKLNELVGLKNLKYNIETHLNLVRFAKLRSQYGLKAAMPPLHMIFTGNPGTGKTTVAKLLGEIYASLGILKTGQVISVDRKTLVGQYIGDTEDNTKRALQQAHGNILLIDEAYTLVADPDDKKDFGPKVLDCLLEELSKEQTDMIIILAGYPDEMEKMMKANKGLQSRFPYTFHFEDYSEDELVEIAVRTAQQSGYTFSEKALERLRALIRREMERSEQHDQKHFGNARFITRLISAYIIPNMSRRVLSPAGETEPSQSYLSRIEASDIPASSDNTDYPIDEALISRALSRLDEMAGLQDVKQTLHNLVRIARSRQQAGEYLLDTIPLQWTFTGSTGTGKSSVARLLAQLLHAFHLISSERMTQLRMPQGQSAPWTPYEIDKTLRDTMKQSGQGLLFIDLDDVANSHIDVQWLRCKLTSLTAEMPGSHAFVIAVDDRRMSSQPIDMPISTSVLHFPDYTSDELMHILRQQLSKRAFVLSEEADKEVFGHIQSLCNNRSCGFANARTIRHIFTAITSAAELRMLQTGEAATPIEITSEDIRSFRWKPLNSNRIGYSA